MVGMTQIAGFLKTPEVPQPALDFMATLLLDTVGVTAGAASLQVGVIAREMAVECYGAGAGASARMMFDGRRASLPGAAFAAATQTDNLDGHDGYNPVKGHIGCAVVPALLAFAEELPDLSGRRALAAMAAAYEIAARAGTALHGTVADYHTSGAWNGLGVAALGWALRGGDADVLRHALGIAEYHGPRSQMMREIANPTMLHDGSGMGAMVGVSALLMAEKGFTGAPAITIEADDVADVWADLGTHWTVEENYIKPWPICRWAHGAIDAVEQVMRGQGLSADDISTVEVRSFAQAAALFAGVPETTSQAQYSLPFAVAVMMRHGKITPAEIAEDALGDEGVLAQMGKISVVEQARFNAKFPAGRWAEVEVTCVDGRVFNSGEVNAKGCFEVPMGLAELQAKFMDFAVPTVREKRAQALWNMRARLLDDAPFSELRELVLAAADG